MNHIKLLFVLFILTITTSNAQLVTLDYATFTPNPSTTCDVFGVLIPVQNIFHETKRGDVTKNSGQGALELKFNYNTGGTNQKGTEFAITGTFKKDYKYTVKITAKNNNTYNEPAGLKCNFDPSGIDPACDGLKFVNANNGTFSSSSSNWFKIVNGATDFTEYTFESDFLSAAQSSLGIGTFSLNNIISSSQHLQTIYIKKIQIFEVPPPPTFTLTSNVNSIACGVTTPIVFTVNNVYNSPGTMTYQWGYPGWSGTVNTSMSSVSLTPNSSTTLPGTVTVTPSLNGVAQPTRTSVVSRSAFTSNASISGSSTVCSSSTYTMSGLLAGQSVTSWVVSIPSKATLSTTSGNSTTVTKIGSGPITLTATITNSCNQTITKSIDFQLGIVNVPGAISGPASVLTGALVNYSVASVPGATSYIWWLPYPYDTFTNFNYSGQNWQKRTNYSSSNSIQVFTGLGGNPGQIQVMAVNACGTSGARKLSVTHGGGGGGIPRPAGSGTQIYPNPAKDFINIELSNQEITTNSDIRAIIYDTNGKELKSIKIISSSTTIGIEDIPSGMYIIEVNIDGEKESHKIYMN
ncbi:T9SS type A sorting domain-containing protein [Maribacter sp. ACAM166]|uniref:T9SS type A sorting domain-containing protein n=1 Tax=Maribacter sp. ACAM166 TaxID=2508996 RepID=UPI0010FF1AF4|nr:T9SS type A sorting domain-containing protein [Maribacter sp. ACAM166]TLP79274.1 T9SS type A sorting domain-containing protein [Maribacter sp. ACAM166]